MQCSICYDDLDVEKAPAPVAAPTTSFTFGVAKKKQKLMAPTSNSKVCSTPCGHLFHRECLTDWIKKQSQLGKQGTCPTCRKVVKDSQLNPLYFPDRTENPNDCQNPACQDLKQRFDLLTKDHNEVLAKLQAEQERADINAALVASLTEALEKKDQGKDQDQGKTQEVKTPDKLKAPDQGQGDTQDQVKPQDPVKWSQWR